jgi:hypothetical protein
MFTDRRGNTIGSSLQQSGRTCSRDVLTTVHRDFENKTEKKIELLEERGLHIAEKTEVKLRMLVTKFKIKISNTKHGVTLLFLGFTDENGGTKLCITASAQ